MPDTPKLSVRAGQAAGRRPRDVPIAADTARAADSEPAETGPFTVLPAQFGRYRIEKLLGQGAMGAVYLARDAQLDRDVALKVARVSPSGSEKLIKRMEHEAKAAAKIDHPQICKVYDFGEIGGIRFIAMQHIEGEDLKTYLRRVGRQREPSEAIELILQIARALEAAHKKGVIHRDLKPENIMLREGIPVIMDFGLARRTTGTTDPGLTQGMIVGTAAYMSPEQAIGDAEGIDHRSDLYSLGVMLFEMLTGDWPFSGSALEVMGQKCVQDPPSPAKLNPALPQPLADLCLRLIARNRDDRFGECAEVVKALESLPACQSPAAVKPVADKAADMKEAPVRLPPGARARLATAKSESSKKTSNNHKGSSSAVSRIANWWKNSSTTARWTLSGVAALSGALAMVLFFSNGKATVKIVVHADDIQVSFKGDAFSVSDGMKQFQVTPGSHALHVSSGGFEFDTDNFTLKRGDNPTLTVERDNGEVTAKLGDRVIGTRPSPGAPARLAQENKTKKSNEPAKTDLDSIATGKWERGISEEQFELTGNATWRLNTAVVRDVVLRADCHKAEDGNVNLWVREVHPNGRTAYVGWYDGQPNGKVGIAIGRDGNWSELVTPVDIVRPEGREFVNVAMSAVGDTLSMYIDGQRVLSAQNAEFTEGTLQVGAFGGRQQFKNVEYQLLNSAPSSASPAPQD